MFKECTLSDSHLSHVVLRDTMNAIATYVNRELGVTWPGISEPVGIIGRKYSLTALHVEVLYSLISGVWVCYITGNVFMVTVKSKTFCCSGFELFICKHTSVWSIKGKNV
jgi:hypothetical protein